MIAKVSIDRQASRLNDFYSYIVPTHLADEVSVGCGVIVPFGYDKVSGYVIELEDTLEAQGLKEIQEVTNPASDFGEGSFALALDLAKELNCSFANIYSLMLPAHLKGKKETYYYVNDYDALDSRVAVYLDGKEKIKASDVDKEYKKYIEKELEKGNLTKGYEFLYYKTKKKEKVYFADSLTPQKSKVRDKVLKYIYNNPDSKIEIIQAATSASKSLILQMEKEDIIKSKEVELEKVTLGKSINKDITFSFSEEECLSYYQNSNPSVPTVLDTDDDEFRINFYLKLIEDEAKKGKKTVFVASSIFKAEDLKLKLNRYLKGYKVCLYHSLQSKLENYEVYEALKREDYDCLIAVLGALFLPFYNVGLVVLEDEEDTNYISESFPYFDLVEVAKKKALATGARLIISSPTPRLVDIFKANNNEYSLIEVKSKKDYDVTICDMRKELLEENNVILSTELKGKISNALDNKKISVLITNNLAYSNELRCRKCGKVLKCPNCKVPLTYSKKKDEARCAYCGYKATNYNLCSCGSKTFLSFGFGIEQVIEKVKETYPNAKVMELSSVTLNSVGKIGELIEAIEEAEVDIIVGTNAALYLSRFENVELVGMLYIDSYLNASNYLASEETYNLIAKATNFKNTVIQTYNKDHFAIKYAVTKNAKAFYVEEIKNREMLNYPPFMQFSKVYIRGDYNETFHFAYYVKKATSLSKDINILGPVYDYGIKGVRIVCKYSDFNRFKKTIDDAMKHFSQDKVSVTIVRYSRGG